MCFALRITPVVRYVGIRSLEPVGVHLPGDQNYPGGGPFDPMGLAGDAEGFVEQVRCGGKTSEFILCGWWEMIR